MVGVLLSIDPRTERQVVDRSKMWVAIHSKLVNLMQQGACFWNTFSEFAKVNMEGTDGHLATGWLVFTTQSGIGTKRKKPSGSPSRRQSTWEGKSGAGMCCIAKSSCTKIWSMGENSRFERLIGDLILSLEKMASPDIIASPILARTCLRGQMAHVGEDWTRASEQWRFAITVGKSVGWPEEMGLALPICSLEAMD